MKRRNILVNLVMLSSISLLIAIATYFVNMWFFSSNLYLRKQTHLSSTDALFLEGIIFFVAGLLFLLGRGGLSPWSVKAAILSSLGGGVGPTEQFGRELWRPKGFVRYALILILAGVFIILIYLLSL